MAHETSRRFVGHLRALLPVPTPSSSWALVGVRLVVVVVLLLPVVVVVSLEVAALHSRKFN